MLPRSVTKVLNASFGSRADIARLAGGKSGAAVYCARYANCCVVVKQVGERERYVYDVLGTSLHEAGVRMPKLHGIIEDEDKTFLVLEHVPDPLPRSRWLADPHVLETLYCLHALHLPPVAPAFRPTWPFDLTQRAIEALDLARDGLADRLDVLHHDAQVLFEAKTLISGDPNPTNWGVRANGELVLFDWDRCGYGHPAIDLAITVPGLGEWSAYRRVASRYLAVDPESAACNALTREIALAKVWVVLSFVMVDGRHTEEGRQTVKAIRPHLVPWLRDVAREG